MTFTVPSAAIAAVAPAALLNSPGTSAAYAGAAGGGGGGTGASSGAGTGTMRAPECVPMNIVWPLGATVTHHTLDGFTPSGCGGPFCSARLATSQNFTAPSRLALARRALSGVKATLVTQSLWPARVPISLESAVFQSLMVRSAPALASFEPSGE